jgi:hypothetical protein
MRGKVLRNEVDGGAAWGSKEQKGHNRFEWKRRGNKGKGEDQGKMYLGSKRYSYYYLKLRQNTL